MACETGRLADNMPHVKLIDDCSGRNRIRIDVRIVRQETLTPDQPASERMGEALSAVYGVDSIVTTTSRRRPDDGLAGAIQSAGPRSDGFIFVLACGRRHSSGHTAGTVACFRWRRRLP